MTFGKDKNRHANKKRRHEGKAMVFGALETGGQIKTKVLPDTTSLSLSGVIKEYVHPGSIMVSDDNRGYTSVKNDYAHVIINHSAGE